MSKENFASFEALETSAKDAGVKDKVLGKAVDTANMPTEGVFMDIEIASPNTEFAHLRLNLSDGSSISCGRLRGSAHFGTIANVETIVGKKEHTKKSVFLKTTTINSQLPANHAKLAWFLKGKKFKAVEKTGYVSPFKTNDKNEAVFYPNTAQGIESLKGTLVPKKFWEVKIIDAEPVTE